MDNAKAVVVIDFPSACGECKLLHYCQRYDDVLTINAKLDNCPLKLIPAQRNYSGHPYDEYGDGYADGWNDCLDEILR